MHELIVLEFSIFSLIAVGFLMRRLKIVSEEGEKNLSNLVLYVILPCNIIVSFIAEQTDGMAYDSICIIGISVIIQIIAVIYGKLAFLKQSEGKKCNLFYAMICSNASFLGNPVAEGIFGGYGLMLASIYLIPQRFMMWSVGLSAYTGDSGKIRAFKKVITHPCVVACLIGLIIMVFRIPLPDLVLSPIQIMAKCNTAMSMLVVGMILSKIDVHDILNRIVVIYTLHRLIIMPLIIYLICSALPVSRIVTDVSVILAAMPAGATTSILAIKYNKEPEFAANMVFFSTLCSIPAIMVWTLILK